MALPSEVDAAPRKQRYAPLTLEELAPWAIASAAGIVAGYFAAETSRTDPYTAGAVVVGIVTVVVALGVAKASKRAASRQPDLAVPSVLRTVTSLGTGARVLVYSPVGLILAGCFLLDRAGVRSAAAFVIGPAFGLAWLVFWPHVAYQIWIRLHRG